MDNDSEPKDLIKLIKQRADLKLKKDEIAVLINKIEAKVYSENNGFTFVEVDELLNSLREKIQNISLNHQHILEALHLRIEEILNNEEYIDFNAYITSKLLALNDFFNVYNNLLVYQNEFLNESIHLETKKLDDELRKLRSLRNSLQNINSENIYEDASGKFTYKKHIYLLLLLLTMFSTSILTFSSLVVKNRILDTYQADIYDYWLLKITIISIAITLISFFLKQVVHYQKKADFAEKISLELKAFPSYVSDLSAEDSIILRKELALKYFGNENFEDNNRKINNYSLEQIRVSTDLAKASLDAVKLFRK